MSHSSGGKSLWERLESIGKARDGLLLVTAGIYGLGYAIRAAHAWREHLGVVPALDSQYFLAGAAPAGVVVAVSWVATRVSPLAERMKAWADKLAHPRGVLAGLYLAAMLLTVGAGLLIGRFLSPPSQVARMGAACTTDVTSALCTARMGRFVLLVPLFYFMLVTLTATRLTPGRDGGARGRSGGTGTLNALLIVVTAVLTLSAALILCFAAYSNLPQELGGLRPDRVTIEMSNADISRQLAGGLFPTAAGDSGSARVIRSVPLALLSSQGEHLVVEPLATVAGSTASYRIKKDLIRVIVRE